MIKLTYDAKVDAFMLLLYPHARSARTIEWAPDVFADLDTDGKVIGIEVLNASTHFDPKALEKLGSPEVRLSLAEASKESGLSTETLRSQLNKGRLPGEKRGRDWSVTRADLVSYLESRAPAGRPAFKYKARRKRPMMVTSEAKPAKAARKK
jgi:uncharacterized protein YuzE